MDKNKRKKYFSSNLMMKKRKNLFLQAGYKGFISTCNGSEKQCVKESYNLLNEYADKIYGEEEWRKKPTDPTEGENDDVMDELEKEIAGYKAKKSGESERRFLAVDTGVFNCIFIKTNLEDPASLLNSIVNDLSQTKSMKTRFLLRMVPIEVTCKAYEDDIKKAAGPLFDKYFKSEPTSFSIVFNRRHNSNVDRDVVIKELAQLVTDRNSKHVVNLTSPTHSIIVEVIKNVCGLSVIRDYFKFSKYNFGTICGVGTSLQIPQNPSKPDDEKPESSSKEIKVDSDPSSSIDQGSKGDDKTIAEPADDLIGKSQPVESNVESVQLLAPSNPDVSESNIDSTIASVPT